MQQLAIDNTRHLLYVLTTKGHIQVSFEFYKACFWKIKNFNLFGNNFIVLI